MQRSLGALSSVKPGFNFLSVLRAELRLMFKGLPWWWYAVALGLAVAALFNSPDTVRKDLLMLTWLWPVLIWSQLGVREKRFGTSQMVFSAARPLTRHLPAVWLAGVAVTALTGAGAGLRFLLGADGQGLAVLLSAMVFIPSFALAAGVWSGTSKLFEVLYVVLWYLGPANHIGALDFLATTGPGRPLVWLLIGIILLIAAILGRKRQIVTSS